MGSMEVKDELLPIMIGRSLAKSAGYLPADDR